MNLATDLLNGADAAAEFTGLSRRAIYHLVEKGAIPYRRIGARLYFRRTELEITFAGEGHNPTASIDADLPSFANDA